MSPRPMPVQEVGGGRRDGGGDRLRRHGLLGQDGEKQRLNRAKSRRSSAHRRHRTGRPRGPRRAGGPAMASERTAQGRTLAPPPAAKATSASCTAPGTCLPGGKERRRRTRRSGMAQQTLTMTGSAGTIDHRPLPPDDPAHGGPRSRSPATCWLEPDDRALTRGCTHCRYFGLLARDDARSSAEAGRVSSRTGSAVRGPDRREPGAAPGSAPVSAGCWPRRGRRTSATASRVAAGPLLVASLTVRRRSWSRWPPCSAGRRRWCSGSRRRRWPTGWTGGCIVMIADGVPRRRPGRARRSPSSSGHVSIVARAGRARSARRRPRSSPTTLHHAAADARAPRRPGGGELPAADRLRHVQPARRPADRRRPVRRRPAWPFATQAVAVALGVAAGRRVVLPAAAASASRAGQRAARHRRGAPLDGAPRRPSAPWC